MTTFYKKFAESCYYYYSQNNIPNSIPIFAIIQGHITNQVEHVQLQQQRKIDEEHVRDHGL
jgi:hypothetical protein